MSEVSGNEPPGEKGLSRFSPRRLIHKLHRRQSKAEEGQVSVAADSKWELVTEPHRNLRKPPVEYERVGQNEIGRVLGMPSSGDDIPEVFEKLTLEDGTRIIIDGIPYFDFPSGRVLSDRCIQIYRNQEGFLVADRIIEDINGESSDIQPKSYQVSDPDLVIERDSLQLQPLHGKTDADNDTELVSTTYKYRHATYGEVEITVGTPDDTGNEVWVSIADLYMPRPANDLFPQPIVFRKVPDN
jgi:hypothetical protein